MSFSKNKRGTVYAKYDGHCAYCGRAIDSYGYIVSNRTLTDEELRELSGRESNG